MKFLIDNALSPLVAERLRQRGYDARHVRDISMQDADDESIFNYAASENRIVVSSDTDFGMLLALRNEAKPSVILLRRGTPRKPELQATFIAANLPALEQHLLTGAAIVMEGTRIRIRSLPIGGAV